MTDEIYLFLMKNMEDFSCCFTLYSSQNLYFIGDEFSAIDLVTKANFKNDLVLHPESKGSLWTVQ